MSAPVAQTLIDEHGEAHVAPRLGNYGGLLDSGDQARHRSALLVDVIRDAANPSLNTGEMAPPSPPPRTAPPAGSCMPTLEEASRSDVSLKAQVDAAQKTLQVLWRERLLVSEHALLRTGLIVGQPDAQEATRAAAIAKVNGTLDDFAADLLLTLGGLRLPPA